MPDPGLGKKLNVECYVSPTPASDAPVNRPDFLAALELGQNRSLVHLLRVFDVTASDKNQLERVRAEAKKVSEEAGQTLLPGYRGAAFFTDDVGTPGMIEFVPTGASEAA